MPENSDSPGALTTQAWPMVDLVEYQADAIVSRTLVKKDTGSVTLFAFDQSQALSEHTAPFDALVLLLDGEAEITINSIPHQLAQGQMILMPANEPHAVKAVTKFKMMLTMINLRGLSIAAVTAWIWRSTG